MTELGGQKGVLLLGQGTGLSGVNTTGELTPALWEVTVCDMQAELARHSDCKAEGRVMNCPGVRKEGILEEVSLLYKCRSNTDFTLVVVSACG